MSILKSFSSVMSHAIKKCFSAELLLKNVSELWLAVKFPALWLAVQNSAMIDSKEWDLCNFRAVTNQSNSSEFIKSGKPVP